MPKVVLNNLSSLTNEITAITLLNQNAARIAAALENTVSRDGTSPNSMNGMLDMNSNRIINLPAPVTDREPVRKQELDAVVAGRLGLTTQGYVVSTLTGLVTRSLVGTANEIDISNGDGLDNTTLSLPLNLTLTGKTITGGTFTGSTFQGLSLGNSNLAQVPNKTIKSNISGGSATPSDNTITAVLDNQLGSTRGSVAYRNGTSWVSLAPGGAGNFLASQGAGADPIWSTAGTGVGDMLKSSYDPSNISADVFSSANTNFVPNGTGAVSRKVQSKLRDTVYVEDFGAVGDGSTDDKAAFDKAVAAVVALSGGKGGVVRLRARAYALSAGITLPSGVKVVGEGAVATTIIPLFTTGFVFSIGNGTLAQFTTVSSLSIIPGTRMTAGALIVLNNHYWATIEHVNMGLCNIGIQILNGAVSYLAFIKDVFVNDCFRGLEVGSGGGTDCANVSVIDCEFAAATDTGVAVLNCGGFMMRGCELLQNYYNFLMYPDTGRRVLGGIITGNFMDTSRSTNCYLATNGGRITDVTFDAGWFSSAGISGGIAGSSNIRIINGSGVIDGITFNSPRIIGASGYGVLLEGGKNITFNAPHVFANSGSGNNLYDGIIVGANVSEWNIIGGKVGTGGTFSPANFQRYGININNGTSDNWSIIGVDVRGNQSGGIIDVSSGTNRVIDSCIGAKTSSQGIAFIPNGTTAVNVPHGLSFTPNVWDVQATDLVDRGAATIGRVWVSAATSTTFTLTASTAATADFYFGWSARVKGS